MARTAWEKKKITVHGSALPVPHRAVLLSLQLWYP